MIVNLGDAPFKAFIKVTYPKGTCTVTNGTKTYTHTGGGTHTFTVNKKGSWTVTASYGSTIKKTSTVSISSRGETKSVSFSYTKTFFNRGLVSGYNFGATAGVTVVSGGNLQAMAACINVPINSYTWSTAQWDLTDYKTLYVTVSAVDNTYGNTAFGLGSSTTNMSLKSKSTTSATTYSLDISSVGKAYFTMRATSTTNVGASIYTWLKVSKIWAEV